MGNSILRLSGNKINLKINGETSNFRRWGNNFNSTGSTVYAYSAGGKMLSTVFGKSKCSICPYKRTFETEITDQNSEIEIICDRGVRL